MCRWFETPTFLSRPYGEGRSAPVGGEPRELRCKLRLARARRPRDSEQIPTPLRIDGGEQLARQCYSLLDWAQRLMSLSVAYLSISASSSSVKSSRSSALTLASSCSTLLAPVTVEVMRGDRKSVV